MQYTEPATHPLRLPGLTRSPQLQAHEGVDKSCNLCGAVGASRPGRAPFENCPQAGCTRLGDHRLGEHKRCEQLPGVELTSCKKLLSPAAAGTIQSVLRGRLQGGRHWSPETSASLRSLRFPQEPWGERSGPERCSPRANCAEHRNGEDPAQYRHRFRTEKRCFRAVWLSQTLSTRQTPFKDNPQLQCCWLLGCLCQRQEHQQRHSFGSATRVGLGSSCSLSSPSKCQQCSCRPPRRLQRGSWRRPCPRFGCRTCSFGPRMTARRRSTECLPAATQQRA